MLAKEFHNIKISGLACAVPSHKIMTDSYKGLFDEKVVERFKAATGIDGRYMSDGTQTASDLSYVAAKALMKEKGLTGEDFDAVINITQSADYKIPATAFILQKRLDIKQDCLVFDINLGCSGFVYGIYIVAGLIESGTIHRALLLVGDANTEYEITGDTSFSMMFGDAASATIIERGKGTIRGMMRSDGEGFSALITPVPGARFPGVNAKDKEAPQKKMDGDEIFVFSITKVPRLFKDFFKTFEVEVGDFDFYVFHQANLMIINQIAKKLKLEPDQVPISLGEYGNTDGASIPVTIVNLCEHLEEDKKLKLITSGFGIGLSWGIVSFEIDKHDVLPMIVTDDYFKDGKNI